MRIRFIKASDTHPLRQLVLRPGQPMEEVDFPHDRDEGTFHLGGFVDDRLVGVASFYLERRKDLTGWKQYRLRGMATHPDHRQQGVGKQLLAFGLDHLREAQADLLWCNARTSASGFYSALGFVTEGAAFELHGVGPHYLMHRKP